MYAWLSEYPPEHWLHRLPTPFTLRFKAIWLVRAASLFFLIFQLVTTIVLAVNNHYDMSMYTYWSYTMLTLFYGVVLAVALVQHTAFTLTALFCIPVILGNVVFVALAIIIIIANNAEAYRDGTVCDTPPGDLTLEKLHTGDWLIHGSPVFGVFLLLLCGLKFFTRDLIVRQLKSWSRLSQWLYAAYWLLSPFVMICIYELSFDVDKKYPTSYSLAERLAIMAGLVLVWQTVTWFIFTQRLARKQVHAHRLSTLRELRQTGHIHAHSDAAPDRLITVQDEL